MTKEAPNKPLGVAGVISTLSICCVKDRDGREKEKNGREDALHLPPGLPNSIPSCTIWKTRVFKIQAHRTACLMGTPATCHLSLLAVTVASFLGSKSAHQPEAEN